MSQFVVCAVYKFVVLNHYQELRAPLLALMEENHIRGTLLLAQEGINGTVASSRQGIDALLAWLENEPSLKGTVYKESSASEPPFNRTKVKLKRDRDHGRRRHGSPSCSGHLCEAARLERAELRS